MLARELCTEGLDLVKVVDLDALLGTPGTQDLSRRGGAGHGDGIVERVHADDGLELGQLVGILEHGGDVVGCLDTSSMRVKSKQTATNNKQENRTKNVRCNGRGTCAGQKK